MRTYLFLTFLFVSLFPLHVFSQSDAQEDVIYLKNGTVYRGTIEGEIYGGEFKIRVSSGVLVTIQMSEIDRITKEKKQSPSDSTHISTSEEPRDTSENHKAYYTGNYTERGGFFQGQINIQYAGGGVRVIGGYKFNQFAMLGAGIGIGKITFGANGDKNTDQPYNGIYLPVFVYYSGEILKREITPFYAIEGGYSIPSLFPLANNTNVGIWQNFKSGPMGSAGLGARFYIGEEFVLSLSVNLDIQYVHTSEYDYTKYVYNNYSKTLLLPAFKIGLGFVK